MVIENLSNRVPAKISTFLERLRDFLDDDTVFPHECICPLLKPLQVLLDFGAQNRIIAQVLMCFRIAPR